MPQAEPAKKVKKAPKAVPTAEQNTKKLTLFETIAEELAEIEKAQEPSAKAPVEMQEVREPESEPSSFDPDETRAIPWSPRLTGSYAEDDEEDQPVLGRLLGRAFGQRRGEEE
jgi:hypothetical protein